MTRRTLYFLLPAVLIALGARSFYRSAMLFAADPAGAQRIVFSVPQGSNASEVADLLEDQELIKSSSVFAWTLRRQGLDGRMRAGKYVLSGKEKVADLVILLTSGKGAELAVTFPEGWTLSQLADRLEAQDLTTREAFLNCLKTCRFDFGFLPTGSLEGYLFPDTYFVNAGEYSDQSFIRRAIATLDQRLAEADEEALKKSGRTLHQVLTMASIVEREESNAAERPTVAGILWKRFEKRMGLGADATVLYALGRTKGGLTSEDLKVNSPYNTRRFAGLPPTPIAAPSLSSIKAALYPMASPYLYYLHDSQGDVHYARTLEEHAANRAKYL